MKKAVCLVLLAAVLSGMLFALKLSDSTGYAGAGFDAVSGKGKTLLSNSEFVSEAQGFYVYAGYDVKIGDKMFSRMEYGIVMFPTRFVLGGTSYGKDSGVRRSVAKNRVGGFIALNCGSNIVLNLGGSASQTTIKITQSGSGDVYKDIVVGVGLILEAQYTFNGHFSLRLGFDPDFMLFTTEQHIFTGEDHYEETQSRAALGLGWGGAAKLGIAYKF